MELACLWSECKTRAWVSNTWFRELAKWVKRGIPVSGPEADGIRIVSRYLTDSIIYSEHCASAKQRLLKGRAGDGLLFRLSSRDN